jgi:diguanylate cyclase (GGDEF)-like protein
MESNFQRNRVEASQPRSREPDSSDASSTRPEMLDAALDTLATVLRDAGNYAFCIGGEDAPEVFKDACEAWARHLLTGAPVAQGKPAVGPAEGVRAWDQVRYFYRSRRQAEARFVTDHLSDYRGILWDFIRELRAVTTSGRAAGVEIQTHLGTLEEAIQGNSLESVRRAIGTVTQSIREVLAHQREEYDSQVKRLSERLASMRDDLLAARQQMVVDPLTQVHNRGSFDATLQRYVALSDLSGQRMALAMVDVDHFKRINDTYGHPVGDKVLKAIADCLARSFLRKADFVARYGGEEFAVLLLDIDEKGAERALEKLLNRVASLEIEHQEAVLRVTCSIGCSLYLPGEGGDRWLARADTALYQAKSAGRARVEFR